MRFLLICILASALLPSCTKEEPQAVHVFQRFGNDPPSWLGPWRDREPVTFDQASVPELMRVTTVLADPDVIDRPFPAIRMPWIKTGNEVTEQAYSRIVGSRDSLSLYMNARDGLLHINNTQFRVQAPLDSFWVENEQGPGGEQRRRFVFRPIVAGGPERRLRAIEFSRERGLELLQVDDALPTGTSFRYTLTQP